MLLLPVPAGQEKAHQGGEPEERVAELEVLKLALAAAEAEGRAEAALLPEELLLALG